MHDSGPTTAQSLPDPLPRRRLLDSVGIGGSIKVRPEDFIVDEIPLYEPTGEGEHLYVRVQATGVSHGEMMHALQNHFRVRESAIGFAGMKDKVAVTQQTVSIHLPHRDRDHLGVGSLREGRVVLLWAARHLNKIRRGHLVGNRFVIRVRDVDPMKAPVVRRQLLDLEKRGVPDYYGSQRFGYRRNNHVLGLMLVRGEWQAMLDELLGARGSSFPAHQAGRRELYDAGQLAPALALWTRNDRAERLALTALVAGRTPQDAVLAIGGHALGFWVSALQSFLFNRVLDRRLKLELFDRLIEGDLAWKHDSRGVFIVTPELLASGTLEPRLQSFDISPSGPIWGSGMFRPTGTPAEIELGVMEEVGLDPSLFDQRLYGFEGTRRPLRARVSNVEIDSGVDEHGPYLRLAFDLPRGAYATVLLREIMGDGLVEAAVGASADPEAMPSE
ncbi:MAG: tRNA pseudouridine(13) synthase TruD [Phycisphaerales bacterium]|nr:tRNA pseudouridine(13) synthase TruD [Phycisphaerales bacterium]